MLPLPSPIALYTLIIPSPDVHLLFPIIEHNQDNLAVMSILPRWYHVSFNSYPQGMRANPCKRYQLHKD